MDNQQPSSSALCVEKAQRLVSPLMRHRLKNRNGNYLMETSNDYLKYIVYITVNLCNGKLYIGYHKTNPNIFDGYIGCGIYRQSNANKDCPFHKAVRKYGYSNFKRTTIQIFPNTEGGLKDALELEKQLVNETFLKSKNVYNLALGGNPSTCEVKRVYMFDLKGNYLRSFKSCREAAMYVDAQNTYTVMKAIRNNCLHSTNSSYGYFWSYTKKFTYKAINPVAQYTAKGIFIRHYNSISEAEEVLGLSTIHQAIVKNCLAGGYQWKPYSGDNSDISPIINVFSKNKILPIIMITPSGKRIRYGSVSACVRENKQLTVSQINRVLKNTIKSHKGFKFEYDVSQDKDIV